MVARLINPDVQDYLYTTSFSEACTAIKYGYIMDGVVMKSAAATAPDSIPVYRIANYERHVFTTDINLRNTYVNNYGYKDEGIGFYAYSKAAAGRTGVHGPSSWTDHTTRGSTPQLPEECADRAAYRPAE